MQLEKVNGKYVNWYFYCLVLFAVSLPFSKFGLSLSQFLLLLVWLLEGRFKEKWKAFSSSPVALALAAIYLIHILGLLHTDNFSYAFKDLRIKLPLLSFAVFSSWIFPLRKDLYERLLKLFLIAMSFAVLVGLFRVWFMDLADIREASMFISHIRFGLLISTAIFISAFYLLSSKSKLFYAVAAGILLLGLFEMRLLTGSVILIAGLLFSALHFIFLSKRIGLKITLSLVVAALLAIPGYLMVREVQNFYQVETLGPTEKLPYTSAGGEVYYHKIESSLHENGTLIWAYIAFDELERLWSRASDLGFKEADAKGQPLYSTLIRFMSSKGLRKDSIGFTQLSTEEIKLIESGLTNYRFNNEEGFSKRIYETLWELENYRNGGNVEGNSVAQRLVFWSTGISILKGNVVFGIGTGDIRDAYDQAYVNSNTELSKRFRLRSHNQFLSLAICFGAIGLLGFLILFSYPAFTNHGNLLFSLVVLTCLLSFLTEDTLETQVGVSFVVFFYCLFGQQNLSKEQLT